MFYLDSTYFLLFLYPFNRRVLNVALGFSGGSVSKELLQCRRPGFDPSRRKWQPTAVFLPEKSHGQRSMATMGLQRVRHN